MNRTGRPSRHGVSDALAGRSLGGATDAVNDLPGAWRGNGQVCGDEFPFVADGDDIDNRALTPESDSLDPRHDGEWPRQYRGRLYSAGYAAIDVVDLGEESDGDPSCACASRSSLILYTTHVSMESPVRCGDCFGPVPLYSLPSTWDGELCG